MLMLKATEADVDDVMVVTSGELLTIAGDPQFSKMATIGYRAIVRYS